MINTVYKALKPLGYPVLWQKRPPLGAKPVISYHFFSQGHELMGNGMPLANGGSLQVDLFSDKDYSEAVDQVKGALTSAGFRLASMDDDLEELDAARMLYHKIMIFSYSESEVKIGKI